MSEIKRFSDIDLDFWENLERLSLELGRQVTATCADIHDICDVIQAQLESEVLVTNA